jgi:hypothetical protein
MIIIRVDFHPKFQQMAWVRDARHCRECAIVVADSVGSAAARRCSDFPLRTPQTELRPSDAVFSIVGMDYIPLFTLEPALAMP